MQVAAEYFKNTTLLLMGVICVAASVEKWNLHKRIALRMVMMAGAKPGMWVDFWLWGSLTLRAAAWNHSDLPIHGQKLPWFGAFFTPIFPFRVWKFTNSPLLFLPLLTPGVSLCSRLLLCFMCCTTVLSMWLSNTSTTAMVMPIVEAVLQELVNAEEECEVITTAGSIAEENKPIGICQYWPLFSFLSQWPDLLIRIIQIL